MFFLRPLRRALGMQRSNLCPYCSTCSMSTICVQLRFYCISSIAPDRLRSPLTLSLSSARRGTMESSPCATKPFAHEQIVGILLEPTHPDTLSHFTQHTRACADHPDTQNPPPSTAPMPQMNPSAREDATRSRRTLPRLAFTARL